MGNSKQAVNTIKAAISDKDRSYAWLSRATAIPYKRILAEVKNENRPITLETTLGCADVLDMPMQKLLGMS